MTTTLKIYIDRVEGDLAVIALTEDDCVRFNLPLRYLPEGAREGDHFQLTLGRDNESRDESKSRIEQLLRSLTEKER